VAHDTRRHSPIAQPRPLALGPPPSLGGPRPGGAPPRLPWPQHWSERHGPRQRSEPGP
jgi:hypothetical protein